MRERAQENGVREKVALHPKMNLLSAIQLVGAMTVINSERKDRGEAQKEIRGSPKCVCIYTLLIKMCGLMYNLLPVLGLESIKKSSSRLPMGGRSCSSLSVS